MDRQQRFVRPGDEVQALGEERVRRDRVPGCPAAGGEVGEDLAGSGGAADCPVGGERLGQERISPGEVPEVLAGHPGEMQGSGGAGLVA